MPIDEVYGVIKEHGLLYLTIPITKLPIRRDRGRYCKFHGTHGHTITECRDFKTQAEYLVRNRYLDEFIDETFPMVVLSGEGEKSDRNLSHKQLVVRVIAGGSTLAGDSNREVFLTPQQRNEEESGRFRSCRQMRTKKRFYIHIRMP